MHRYGSVIQLIFPGELDTLKFNNLLNFCLFYDVLLD